MLVDQEYDCRLNENGVYIYNLIAHLYRCALSSGIKRLNLLSFSGRKIKYNVGETD